MINNLLHQVQKPTRYLGNELNSIHKNKTRIRFGFCFPDVYEIGMSHLGLRIMYHTINLREDTTCERVFAPWNDMENLMRKENVPLFSLESQSPIKEFDFVGFTLQYEMSFSNVVNMLDLAQIPLLSQERGENDPIVIAGGPCAFNPEPLSDFIDFFVIGEGEEIINEILDCYKENRNLSRKEKLLKFSEIEGIYVPSFYHVKYFPDNTICSINKTHSPAPVRVKKRIIKDLDNAPYPEKTIVPFMDIVHDRNVLEVFRGCIRGCRFCQAGMIYRPVRERSIDKLTDLAGQMQKNTGYEEMSMSSLSTSDYSNLNELTYSLLEIADKSNSNLALPSLRVDNFSVELMERVQKMRKSSLTFAPEAGTQRMRDVINKNVLEEDLLDAVKKAFIGGWSNIKLYFMYGLPYETIDDVLGIADLAEKVLDVYYETLRATQYTGESDVKIKKTKGNRINITVSTSAFVPKPFTPFQWIAQNSIEDFQQKQKELRGKIKSRKITYNWHDPHLSYLEGVFARGDRRLGKVLLAAHKLGCKFDGWNEFFNYNKWMEAFESENIDPDFYTRKRPYDEILPWSIIDPGVSTDFLIEQDKQAQAASTTPNCREMCSNCGITSLIGGACNV